MFPLENQLMYFGIFRFNERYSNKKIQDRFIKLKEKMKKYINVK